SRGVFVGTGSRPVFGLLCSGQGSPKPSGGGRWSVRFPEVRELYSRQTQTPRTAQESIVVASLAALRVLDRSGIRAEVAVGHSLGELTAMHGAGVLDDASLLRLVHHRAMTMGQYGEPHGAMAAIAANADAVRACLSNGLAVVACLNGPTQTVISGDRHAV